MENLKSNDNSGHNDEGFMFFKQLTLLTKNGLITSAVSYLLTITLANYLGPEGFGLYSYTLILGSIASVLVAFSTDSTSPVMHAAGKTQATIFNSVYSTRISLLLIVLAGLPWLLYMNSAVALGVLAIALASMNLGFLYELSKNNVRYSYVYMIERIIYVSTIFLLIFFSKTNLVLIMSFLLFFTAASCIWQLYDNKESVYRFSFNFDQAANTLKDNFYLVLISLSTFVYGGFSRLILENKFGMADLGVYSAGWQIIMAVTLFQAQADKVWRVKLTTALLQRNKNRSYTYLKNYFLLTTLPVLALAIFVYTYTSELVNLIFGDEYFLLHDLIPIFCIYFLVINLNSLVTICWISVGNRAKYLFISMLSGILLIAALLFLPKDIGLPAFAFLVVIIHGASSIFLLFKFYFSYMQPWTSNNDAA
jgi:O-antigen/teichoic acid export membrane protein